MKLTLLVFFTLGINQIAFAQSDFTSVKEQHVIARHHIKQIKCYWFKDASKPTDSTLINNWIFDKKGHCQKQVSNGATTLYRYNPKGNLTGETIQQSAKPSIVNVYRYDAKGNIIQSARIKGQPDVVLPFNDYVTHKFTYNNGGNVLREYWVNAKGKIHQQYRYEYITQNIDTTLQKIVNFYDADDKLTFIKKYYKNHQVKDFSVDKGKTTFVAESVLNGNSDLIKFADYYHFNDESMRQVENNRHGIIKRDTITEVYKYTPYGFCVQKSTYKRNKLVENLKWHFTHEYK